MLKRIWSAIGATVDPASTDSTAVSSLVALTKGLLKALVDVWDSVNHLLAVGNTLYNETGYDRQRGNAAYTLLASAARTTTASGTSADQTNFNGRGLVVFLNITANPSAGSLTLEIDMKDPVSGSYVSFLTGAAVTANGLTNYRIVPGGLVAANIASNDQVTRTFRVKVVHATADSYTYSVGASVQV